MRGAANESHPKLWNASARLHTCQDFDLVGNFERVGGDLELVAERSCFPKIRGITRTYCIELSTPYIQSSALRLGF